MFSLAVIKVTRSSAHFDHSTTTAYKAVGWACGGLSTRLKSFAAD